MIQFDSILASLFIFMVDGFVALLFCLSVHWAREDLKETSKTLSRVVFCSCIGFLFACLLSMALAVTVPIGYRVCTGGMEMELPAVPPPSLYAQILLAGIGLSYLVLGPRVTRKRTH